MRALTIRSTRHTKIPFAWAQGILGIAREYRETGYGKYKHTGQKYKPK